MNRKSAFALVLFLTVLGFPASAQNTLRPTPEVVRSHFMSINKKILDMAKDFPEDKYDFRLKPEMRSFRELIVHIAGGNVYAAKAGRGENVAWDDSLELDPKNYKTKADVVAFVKKSFGDGAEAIKSKGDSGLSELVVDPDSHQQVRILDMAYGLIEHSGEHYGQLVVYYRVAGLVPPESRPKK